MIIPACLAHHVGMCQGEMAKVVMEAEDANGQCSLSFRSLQESCPYTTMAVHETKRIHTCANYVNAPPLSLSVSLSHVFLSA